MRWRDLFRHAEPTGREPVTNREPASREELAALGARFATPQPVNAARPIHQSPLFSGKPNFDDGACGPGAIF